MTIFVDLGTEVTNSKGRLPDRWDSPLVLALHGLTGDENSMGIFTSHIPAPFAVIMPRGIFSSQYGGFSWVRGSHNYFPTLDEFREAANSLEMFRQELFARHTLKPAAIHLMGFSQGAALAYALLVDTSWGIKSVAALSGFLPPGFPASSRELQNRSLKVYIAHGARDERVPVAAAREAVTALKLTGAEVGYCESDTGHKLGTVCLQNLHQFYKGLL